jgi:hypothetical protein
VREAGSTVNKESGSHYLTRKNRRDDIYDKSSLVDVDRLGSSDFEKEEDEVEHDGFI